MNIKWSSFVKEVVFRWRLCGSPRRVVRICCAQRQLSSSRGSPSSRQPLSVTGSSPKEYGPSCSVGRRDEFADARLFALLSTARRNSRSPPRTRPFQYLKNSAARLLARQALATDGIASVTRDRLSEPYPLSTGAMASIGASVGIAFATNDASFELLMKRAERSLYDAKEAGKVHFVSRPLTRS